jgi:hypothetical protein
MSNMAEDVSRAEEAADLGAGERLGETLDSDLAQFDDATLALVHLGLVPGSGRRAGCEPHAGSLRLQRRICRRRPECDLRLEAMTLCALCRRNLLAGERFRYWRDAEPRHVVRVVCNLCEPEARRGGWLRAAERESERENAVGLRGTVRLVA